MPTFTTAPRYRSDTTPLLGGGGSDFVGSGRDVGDDPPPESPKTRGNAYFSSSRTLPRQGGPGNPSWSSSLNSSQPPVTPLRRLFATPQQQRITGTHHNHNQPTQQNVITPTSPTPPLSLPNQYNSQSAPAYQPPPSTTTTSSKGRNHSPLPPVPRSPASAANSSIASWHLATQNRILLPQYSTSQEGAGGSTSSRSGTPTRSLTPPRPILLASAKDSAPTRRLRRPVPVRGRPGDSSSSPRHRQQAPDPPSGTTEARTFHNSASSSPGRSVQSETTTGDESNSQWSRASSQQTDGSWEAAWTTQLTVSSKKTQNVKRSDSQLSFSNLSEEKKQDSKDEEDPFKDFPPVSFFVENFERQKEVVDPLSQGTKVAWSEKRKISKSPKKDDSFKAKSRSMDITQARAQQNVTPQKVRSDFGAMPEKPPLSPLTAAGASAPKRADLAIPATTRAPSDASDDRGSSTTGSTLNISNNPVNKAKAILTRPFGRTSLPASVSRKWVVEVSSAEWDADEQRWKYRILVQRRQLDKTKAESQPTPDDDSQQQQPQQQAHSFTTAFTWRSVGDFLWLEGALRREFHGGLLLPVLSIALGRPVDSDLEDMPVEAEKLRFWLSDVLNGIRGNGELILDHDDVDIIKSESMEAFLYRNAGPLALEPDLQGPAASPRDRSSSRRGRGSKDAFFPEDSFVHTLFSKPFSMVSLEFCIGPQPLDSLSQSYCGLNATTDRKETRRPGRWTRAVPVEMMPCSSRALGTAPSFDVQDSFVDSASYASPRGSTSLAVHSELLEAEKELVLNYRKTALIALEKLRNLIDEEEKVGQAWKRFAISLSNLFSYEKDVENARLGEGKIKKDNIPYRKVAKSVVDDGLRVLARQEADRAVPSLIALQSMLTAYVADLSAVEPSVDIYMQAMITALDKQTTADKGKRGAESAVSWEERIRGLTASTAEEVKGRGRKTLKEVRASGIEDAGFETPFYQFLLENERLLRNSLTSLCRATPIRAARMAWRYWRTDASQAALLNSAAVSLRARIDVANKDSVTSMHQRHEEQSRADDAVEFGIVQQILKLGRPRKGEGNEGEDEEEDDDDSVAAAKRERALALIKKRPGRWDSEVAMALMESVGVKDPNVSVEETTRDLRLVRKYAIGLREHLNRCVEAADMLCIAVTGLKAKAASHSDGNEESDSIRARRHDFWSEMARLFSGTFIQNDSSTPRRAIPSVTVLTKAGIFMNDPFGWNEPRPSSNGNSRTTFTQGKVGDLAYAYVVQRDSRTGSLLSRIYNLLTDYYKRIEVVEGFVYMECVGIQLEKHFSHLRSTALSQFERKTDVTSAINIATRKKLPKLVKELQVKLNAISSEVSHTHVKEMKEAHLESKNLKTELHELAMRRLLRARERSTERIVAIMSFLAKEEETGAASELKTLSEAMGALEATVSKEDVDAAMRG